MYSGTYLANLTVHSTVPVLSIKSVLNSTCCTDLIWGTFENVNSVRAYYLPASFPQ